MVTGELFTGDNTQIMNYNDLLISLLVSLRLQYTQDRSPAENITIQCNSAECRSRGEGRKPKMVLRVSPSAKSAAGAYKCWVCGDKGKDFVKDIDRVLPKTAEGVVPSVAFAALIEEAKKGKSHLRETYEGLLNASFPEKPQTDIDLVRLLPPVLSGVQDKEKLQFIVEALGLVEVDGQPFMRHTVGDVGSMYLPIHEVAGGGRGAAFEDLYLRIQPTKVKITDDLYSAIFHNCVNCGKDDVAIYLPDNSSLRDQTVKLMNEARGSREGTGMITTLVSENKVGYTRKSLDKGRKICHPDGSFPPLTSDKAALIEAVDVINSGHVAESDFKELSLILDNVVVQRDHAEYPTPLLVLGGQDYIDAISTMTSFRQAEGGGMYDVVKMVCRGNYKSSFMSGRDFVTTTGLCPEEVGTLKTHLENMSHATGMIIAIGDGFTLFNSLLDDPLNIDLTTPQRKHLYNMAGWLHSVQVKGKVHRLLVIPTEEVHSPVKNKYGKINKLVEQSNSVFTALFRKYVSAALRFYLQHLGGILQHVPQHKNNPRFLLEGVNTYLKLTDSAFDDITEFCNGRVVGMDIETTGLHPYRPEAKFKLLSIAVSDGVETHSVWLAGGKRVEEFLLELFIRCKKAVFHNAEFDLKILMFLFPKVREYVNHNVEKMEDTGGLAKTYRIFGSTQRWAEHSMISLNNLTKVLFGVSVKESSASVNRREMWKYLSLGMVERRAMLQYNGGDSLWTVRSYHELFKVKGLWSDYRTPEYTYYRFQMKVVVGCCNMSINGIPLSIDGLIEVGEDLFKGYVDTLKKINDHPIVKSFLGSEFNTKNWETFNPSSLPQREGLALNFLGLPAPDERQVKAHGNSKAGYWQFVTSTRGSMPNKEACEVFSLMIEYGQMNKMFHTAIKPYTNVIIHQLRDDLPKLKSISFLNEGEGLNQEKIEALLNSEGEDDEDEEDGLQYREEYDSEYTSEEFNFMDSSKASNHFYITSVDSRGILRLHPLYVVFSGPISGRLASRSPNVQNISPQVRGICRVPEGYTMIACDSGQADVRMAAVEAYDTQLIENLYSGIDTHTIVMQHLLEETKGTGEDYLERAKLAMPELPESKVLKEIRRSMKSLVVFAFIYGSYFKQIQESLGISDDTFNPFFKFVSTYLGGIDKWHKDVIAEYKQKGYYVRRISGVRLQGDFTANQLYNLPIQNGTALWALSVLLPLVQEGIEVIGHVHDEVIVLVRVEDAERVSKLVAKTMCTAAFHEWPNLKGILPLVAEVCIADRWDKLKSSTAFEDSSENYGIAKRLNTKPSFYAQLKAR
jgi:DNA polymerase family A/3'-5' exonuclease